MLDMGNRAAGDDARMRPRRVRRLVLALAVAVVMAAGVLAFLVLVVVPSADAAGGCGGG